jgi:1-deoxy-D-xylulose-5-phosphate synthase
MVVGATPRGCPKMDNIFEKIESPDDIKKLSINQLDDLAKFLRKKIITTISKTGGHLASSLGTVDLTVALHYVFNSPVDKLVWDVGHQCYAHKLLTGRMDSFDKIRQYEGISGFPKMQESAHDPFGAGHSSTSISSALGLAKARDHQGGNYDVVAIIGDGALTGGLAYEGLNNAGILDTNLIVVLNDNEMSISRNVGAVARHLSQLRMEPRFVKARDGIRRLIKRIPRFGPLMLETAETIEEHLSYLISTGVMFETLGFSYFGPFDGHDVAKMVNDFKRIKTMPGARVIHLLTQKGKGYEPAEKDATKWHGAIPFDVETGNGATPSDKSIPDYSGVLCKTLISLAEKDSRIVAITAAMPDGTGLSPFRDKFPDRFYDVGIAEQHAVTFAAGLAAGGMRPVVALYSTFLQRAYDQIVHDVCLQKLPVVFVIDRGGLVGEDGPTHHGVFDYSFLRSIPDIILAAPKDENELQHLLKSAFDYASPVVIRYPRGRGVGVRIDPQEEWKTINPGTAEIMCEGKDVAILAIGSMVYPAILASEKLNVYGISASVVNMRFVKPLDVEMILKLARKTRHIVTVEENALQGGFGSAVMEVIHENGIYDCQIESLGVPDHFIEHGNINLLKEKYGLSSDGIIEKIKNAMQVAT